MTIIRKMKKSEFFSVHSLFVGLCGAFALIFALASCDVGLGESIDTSTPTVSINYPSSSSSVSGDLVIKGSANDDKSLDKVVLTIKNTATGEVTTQTTPISGKNWEVVLDKLNFPDGTYSVDVVAYDGAGRVSGTASRVFDVDNTPPVFCVTKPNSIKITDPAAFGRDVTIKGEIADDHAITQMDIRVFTDDGTEITSSLAKTSFSGFETAGGTEVTIAKYFETEPSNSSDDYKLYLNYKAMYTNLPGVTPGATVNLYIFPYLTDAAGNVSERCYIQSSFKQLAARACGVDTTCDSLQTAQLKKILNGSYDLTDFDEDQLATMEEILDGTYDQSLIGTDLKYFSTLKVDGEVAGQVPLTMSLNSNNSPMYEFGGYLFDKDDPVFKEVSSGGQMAIKVSAGLDGNQIQANTVRVLLWECDDHLEVEDPTTPSYSSDYTDPDKTIEVKDSDGNIIKSLGSDVFVTNATYNITLPSNLQAGIYYKVTATGKDKAESSLDSMSLYGFMVATTGDAPKVEFDDQFFVNAKALASSGTYKAKINITDKSGTDGTGTLKQNGNWVKVKPILYKGYAKTKGYLLPGDILYGDDERPTITTKYEENNIKGGTGGLYYVEYPINIFDLTGDCEAENYTLALQVQAKNTGATSETTTYIIWADNAAPSLEITAPAREEGATGHLYIFENNKNITATTSAGVTSYAYTARGTWKDLSGSGTSQIWYAWDSPSDPLISWNSASGTADEGTTYYTKQSDGLYIAETGIAPGASVAGKYTLSVGSGWTPIPSAPKSVSKANWNQSIPVSNSSGRVIKFVAVDQTGNLSQVSTVSDITFDFAPPVITLPDGLKQYYVLADATSGKYTFAVGVADASGIGTLSVVAKKFNQTTKAYDTISSGTNGYSVSYATGMTTATVTLTAGTSDGLWAFEVTAADTAERTSQKSFGFTIDTVSPERVYSDSSKSEWITIGTDGSTSDWNNTQNLTLTGKFKEATSGLDKVVYYVTPAPVDSSLALDPETEAIGGKTGDDITYKISPVGFKEGKNSISIKSFDLAGNESESVAYDILVDTTAPLVSSAYYTYGSDFSVAAGTVVANGLNDMTVYGTLEETLSGIDSVKFMIGSEEIQGIVQYTTTPLTGSSTPAEYIGASWVNYAAADNKAYKGYKAVISAAKLASLQSGDVEVFAVATDIAKNETKQQKFIISLDNKAPEVEIKSPEAEAYVNGTVTFSGVVDDTYLSSVKAYWSLNGDATIDESGTTPRDNKIDAITGTYSWNVPLAVTTVDPSAKTITFVDGSLYNGTSKTVYLKILASDRAENKTVVVQKYVIDPQTDRPKITLTTAALDGMSDNNYVWYDSTKLEGTIEDDDGISEFKYSINNGTTWSPITSSGGSWDVDLGTDNEYKILFYVKDSAGTEFTSVKTDTSAIYLSPIIAGKDKTFSTGDTKLYLKVDTKRPEYTDLVYKTSSVAGGPYIADIDPSKLGTVGGLKKYVQFEFNAKDANGIETVSLILNGTSYTGTVGSLDTATNTYPCVITDVDVSALETDAYSATLELKGTFAADVMTESLPIIVDNTAPAVTKIAPDQNAVYGDITVYGTIDYAKTMQYALGLDSAIAPEDAEFKNVNGYGQTWFLYFDGDNLDSTTESHGRTFEWFIINKAVTAKCSDGVTRTATAETIANQTFDAIVPVYVWIKAEDDVGNLYKEGLVVNYDPQGGRPTFTFGYPEKDEARVGGSNIKLYGGADDDQGVKAVFLQMISTQHNVIKNPDGTIKFNPSGKTFGTATYEDGKVTVFDLNANDLDYLKAAGYKVYKMEDYPTLTEWNGSGTPSEYGVLADFKGSAWSLKINSSKEFDPSSDTNQLVICGYAYDGSKFNLPIYRQVKVDADSPVISNMFLKQYASSTATSAKASKEYTEGMYVKGVWNLEFDLTDHDDITKVFVGTGTDAAVAKKDAEDQQKADTSDKSTKKMPSYCVGSGGSYHVKMGLETGAGVGGKHIYILFADIQGHTSNYAFAINYDNVDPVISSVSISDDIHNTNGFYSIEANVSEATYSGANQSGFDRFVVYFKRGNKIYDPMISKKKAGSDNPNNWASVTGNPDDADGLYWFSQTLAARDADNLNVIELTAANAHIHAGRLVKIGGSIYKILSVSDDEKKLTLDGQVEKEFTTAQFAYGNVVDNNKKEVGSAASSILEDYGYGYPTSITNDDGDGMVEWAQIQGTTCSLTADINSRNIPDGKIDVYYVAFDAAGNIATGSVGNAYVSNNAPRLASVTVASDYNYDGTYSVVESRVYTPGARTTGEKATAWDKAWDKLTLGTSVHPFIAAKGDVKVKPEVLGGNGALTWSWTYPKDSAQTSGGAATALSTDTPLVENERRTINDITLLSTKLSDADDGAGEYNITIFDATEDGAQTAGIKLYMKNDVKDNETPVAKTKRFYWKSLTNNSVYGSNSAQSQADLKGHIELEDETTFGDTKPKVSGKIVIKGTAFDNAGIKELKLTIPGILNTATTVATCDYTKAPESRWTQTGGSLADDGYHFTLATGSERYTNTGHFVSWTLEFDTEKTEFGTNKLSANKNVNFVLGIVDKNSKASSASVNPDMTVYATDDQAAKGKYYSEERFAAADETDDFDNADYNLDEFKPFVPDDIAQESDTAGVNKYVVTPVDANYTMDIVPYITKVNTSLSAANAANGVKDRSSLGRYPIYVYKNSGASAVADGATETVTINGFNLKNAKFGDISLGNSTNSSGTLLSNQIDPATLFVLTVNGVNTLNNSNNNNAKGSYASSYASDGDIPADKKFNEYKNYINRQPNGKNNNNLTDDIYFDVWQINNMAAAPMSGAADDPQMKINPKTGQIGFVFSNGSSAFTMPSSTESWRYWAYDYDRVCYLAMAYQPGDSGKVWMTGVGQDTSNGNGDVFFMESTNWRNTPNWGNHGYDDIKNQNGYFLRLESTHIGSSTTNIMQDRIQSPSLATSKTGLFLVYYDAFYNEIKYRAGKFSALPTGKTKGSECSFGFFQDLGGHDDQPTTRINDNDQIVATSTIAARLPGKYVSVAAVDGTDGGTDVAVMVWQDGSKTRYSYTTSDPYDASRKKNKDTTTGTVTINGWSDPIDVFAESSAKVKVSGEYCKIAVVGKSVHIAAYDVGKSDLYYAYLPTYDCEKSAIKVAKVDSYQNCGDYVTLDAALDANGNPAPQIGYYSMASGRPKYARWNPNAAGNITTLSNIDGCDAKDSYTGNWEVTNIPTISGARTTNTEAGVKQNINVGVWKDANGKIKASTTGTSFCIGSATGGTAGLQANNYGDVYGNGSKNAVLGYTYGSNSAAYIETAQRIGNND